MAYIPNTAWLDLKRPPEVRFHSFRCWLSQLLFERLSFSENPERRARQLGQCEAIVLHTVTELEQRGFRLDGPALKSWIETKIITIAEYQEKNLIDNFFIYFKRSWGRYVEQQAEDLKERTKSNAYLKAVRGLKTVPQLAYLAEEDRLREKLRKRQNQAAKKAGEKNQQTLF